MKPSNTLQFQHFWDFTKCLGEIFSQLYFENVWLYLLGEDYAMIKIIKNYLSHLLKSVN